MTKTSTDGRPTSTTRVTATQILDVTALEGSPSASQFLICKNAPKAGVNSKLQRRRQSIVSGIDQLSLGRGIQIFRGHAFA